jgi:toxin-antitoxin system PIN domain toxin
MILLDVNVLLPAHRAAHPLHRQAKEFIESLLKGDAPFGIPQIVLQSLIRISTQPILKPPSTPAQAFAFCEVFYDCDHCHVLHPSPTHWDVFRRLALGAGARGNLVADAYLAAFAIDRDDEWVTLDRDFAKFRGLRWRMLGDAKPRVNQG